MKIALGSVQFGLPYGITNRGGIPCRQEVADILTLAASAGVDTIDTAISYGESERVLGEVGFPGFRIVTKLPGIPDAENVERWVGEQVSASLDRLRVQKIYGLLLHSPGQLLEERGTELYAAVQRLKHDHRVEKIGISVYSPDELQRILPIFPMDLVQVPFNVFDTRVQSTGWLGRMKDEGVEVHARSTFLQGLLLVPYGELPEQFYCWSPLFFKWAGWLEANRVSALEACLSLPLFHDQIDRVVIGVESASQLSQILRAANNSRRGLAFDPGSVDEELIHPGKWT